MSSLAAPRNVSALIRVTRWSALLFGVMYGARRYNTLAKEEVTIQERDNKVRAKRDIRLTAERKQASLDELGMLGKEVGTEIK